MIYTMPTKESAPSIIMLWVTGLLCVSWLIFIVVSVACRQWFVMIMVLKIQVFLFD